MGEPQTIVQALRDELGGDVVGPDDLGWDEDRRAWNLTADQNPAAVAYVQSAGDVAAAVRLAREQGLGVATQGTGHGAAPMAPLDEVLLLKTGRMDGVEVDAAARTARVEAGVLWLAMLEACDPAGLAGLAGSSPDVGVVGYSLGGGLGWLGRKHGLACNRVLGFDVVTADGELRRVDASSEPELFWALRGGGGSFAVVTAMDVSLVAAREVYAGTVVLPAEGGREIFQAYREWADGVPEELTSVARFLHLPPLPQIPELLRDRPLVTIGACYLGPEEEGAELVAPMKGLADPIMDTFAQTPPSGLVRVHMDPEEPVPGIVHGALVRELDERAVDAFVDAAGPESGSPLLSAELRQLGGALARPADAGGALSHLDAGFAFNGVGMGMGPGAAELIQARQDQICDALGDWLAEGCYLNFTERPTDFEELFPKDVGTRLREVKRDWDPENMIRANHGVPAAA
jgi:hypothetical protein